MLFKTEERQSDLSLRVTAVTAGICCQLWEWLAPRACQLLQPICEMELTFFDATELSILKYFEDAKSFNSVKYNILATQTKEESLEIFNFFPQRDITMQIKPDSGPAMNLKPVMDGKIKFARDIHV